MEQNKVDMFIMTNGKFFESNRIPYIHERLLELSDTKFLMLQSVSFHNPTMLLVVSFLGGGLGIDRFIQYSNPLCFANVMMR